MAMAEGRTPRREEMLHRERVLGSVLRRSRTAVLATALAIGGAFALPSLGAQTVAVFPQFATQGGWSSTLLFTNQNLSQVSGVTISFYDNNGNPLSVATSLGTNSSFTLNTLNPGGTQEITVSSSDKNSSDTLVGYVVLGYPSQSSMVGATEVYSYEPATVVEAELGVSQQPIGNNFSFPVEVNSSQLVDTGIAIVNTSAWNPNLKGGVAETAVLTLINSDGSINSQTTMPLNLSSSGAGAHTATYLDQLFSGLDNFVGSLNVSSPLGVGVVALRQENQAFGSISVNTGAMAGPFVVTNGNVVQEQEGNNSAETAQQINPPTIVSGAIATIGEQDIFSFSAQIGQILSVVCDTQSTQSYLTPVLALYDSNENLLALDLVDGFMEMVIPASGTYFLLLEDYYGNGGSNYTYDLNVNLQ